MKEIMVITLITVCTANAMRVDPEYFGAGAGAGAPATSAEPTDRFEIDANFIGSLITDPDFQTFLDNKKAQRKQLEVAASIPFGFGTKILQALGVVDDVEHARTFLKRMFEDEITELEFRAIASNLHAYDANRLYLQALFKQVDPQSATHDDMRSAMKKVKHPYVPNPSEMGTRNDDGTYVLGNKHCHHWAACNMVAFYYVEWRDKQSPRTRRRGLKKPSMRKGDGLRVEI